MIRLEKVTKQDEYILQNMMQFYLYEFSRYIPSIKLEANGLYAPYPLEKWWSEPNLHPFLIRKDEELAGFALVESSVGEEPNSIIEFFISSKHKGKGYGKAAATKIFHMFPGDWEVTEIENNYPAQAFWRGLIKALTNGKFTERYDDHHRAIQRFHTDDLKGGELC